MKQARLTRYDGRDYVVIAYNGPREDHIINEVVCGQHITTLYVHGSKDAHYCMAKTLHDIITRGYELTYIDDGFYAYVELITEAITEDDHTELAGYLRKEILGIKKIKKIDVEAKTINLRYLKLLVKKAFKEARNWERMQPWGYAVMRIDVDDASIWPDVYTDSNSYTIYASDSITNLTTDGWDTSGAYKVEHYLDIYIRDAKWHLKKNGWTVIDDETN